MVRFARFDVVEADGGALIKAAGWRCLDGGPLDGGSLTGGVWMEGSGWMEGGWMEGWMD